MYEEDLALNNLQWLIWHKTQPNNQQIMYNEDLALNHHDGWYAIKPYQTKLPYYLSIARGKIIGVILFPRVFVLCKMQTASSRIWFSVVESTSDDDNHYTMCASDDRNIKSNSFHNDNGNKNNCRNDETEIYTFITSTATADYNYDYNNNNNNNNTSSLRYLFHFLIIA